MSSAHKTSKPSGPLDDINMASPLPLRDWNDAFKLSSPIRPSPRHTPSKTNWKLGAPQRTPQGKTPASVQFRPSSVRPTMSVRRVQQGAAAASTPAQAGQKFLPKSQTSDLIAPSLANLPNALSAEYWLTKAQSHEEAGDLQAAINVFELANKRDVRPATLISRAYGEFLIRHQMQQPVADTPAHKMPSTVKARATPASVRHQSRLDEDQENSQKHNVTHTVSQQPMTPKTAKGKRRQSRVQFQMPEANVVSEASDPLQDDRNNSSQAGSTPFLKAKPARRVSFAAPDSIAKFDRNITTSTTADANKQEGVAKLRHGGFSNTEALAMNVQHSALCPSEISGPADALPQLIAAPGSTPYLKKSAVSAATKAAAQADRHAATSNAEVNVTQINLSLKMSQLLQDSLSDQDLPDETVQEPLAPSVSDGQTSLAGRQNLLLGNRLSPDSGAIHLTPTGHLLRPSAQRGTEETCSVTPAVSTAPSPSSTADVTPLCFDLSSLSLSTDATPAWPQSQTIRSDISLLGPELASPNPDLPAEYSMSPEILGWHEQHDADNVETAANTPEQLQPSVTTEQTPGLQAGHLPASAFKSAQLSLTGAIGKASRIQTPAASRSRLGRNELKGLGPGSPPKTKQDMGSIALLSPVRANNRTTQQLGAAKVITPVRRSARKSISAPALAFMLRETEFAYAPNEALARPRHTVFDPLSPAEASAAATEHGDEGGSTPSSVTGVSLAGEYSIPAVSPNLEEEVSFATHSSSSRLSSQSPTLLSASTLFSATPPEQMFFSLRQEQKPAAGPAWPVQQLNSTSRVQADGDDVLAEVTNTETSAGLSTPPPASTLKASPQGPVTRSKSAKKAMPLTTPVARSHSSQSPSLSPTEAGIREVLRRSARLHKHLRHVSK